jgi:hypothetical protein
VSDAGGSTSGEGGAAKEARGHRKLISGVLLAALIATAFAEPVKPVTHAFEHEEIGIQTLAWLAIYLLTVLRFFAGYVVHFENPELTEATAAPRWFLDLSVVALQWLVLIFAGSVTSLYASHKAAISFPDYLVLLYAIDIAWILVSHLLDWLAPATRLSWLKAMKRGSDLPPWEWAVVNFLLGVLTWLLAIGHPASIPDGSLWVLVAANLAAFFYDVTGAAGEIRNQAGARREPRPWLRRLLRRPASGGSGGGG